MRDFRCQNGISAAWSSPTRTVHEATDGRRYLVVHGDAFDGVVNQAQWRTLLGDWAYRALLHANTGWNRVRRRFGLGYWSFAAFLKSHVKNCGPVHRFAVRRSSLAARGRPGRGLDGVICGHIHTAEHRVIDGVIYVNDGDRGWKAARPPLEHFDGRIELLRLARD